MQKIGLFVFILLNFLLTFNVSASSSCEQQFIGASYRSFVLDLYKIIKNSPHYSSLASEGETANKNLIQLTHHFLSDSFVVANWQTNVSDKIARFTLMKQFLIQIRDPIKNLRPKEPRDNIEVFNLTEAKLISADPYYTDGIVKRPSNDSLMAKSSVADPESIAKKIKSLSEEQKDVIGLTGAHRFNSTMNSNSSAGIGASPYASTSRSANLLLQTISVYSQQLITAPSKWSLTKTSYVQIDPGINALLPQGSTLSYFNNPIVEYNAGGLSRSLSELTNLLLYNPSLSVKNDDNIVDLIIQIGFVSRGILKSSTVSVAYLNEMTQIGYIISRTSAIVDANTNKYAQNPISAAQLATFLLAYTQEIYAYLQLPNPAQAVPFAGKHSVHSKEALKYFAKAYGITNLYDFIDSAGAGQYP